MADSAVKSILSLGEEGMAEVIKQLLANERFVKAMQSTVVGSLEAKRTVDKGLTSMLGLVNIPTVEDVDKVRARLAEVEELTAQLTQRLNALSDRLDDDD